MVRETRRVVAGLAGLGLLAGCTSPQHPGSHALSASSAPTPNGGGPPTPSGGPAVPETLRSEVADRAAHTATTLPDGRVLVAGGCISNGCSTASSQTFVVAADGQRIRRGPELAHARDAHTASLTPSAVVLAGGFAGEGRGVVAEIERLTLDGSAGRVAGALRVARGGHAAATLGDGSVLVVGGWVAPRTYTAAAELIRPDGSVDAAAPLPWAADALDAVTLADGRVLVTGGQARPGVGVAHAAVYDPRQDAWRSAGDLETPRLKHTGILLSDGRVLVIGGTPDDGRLLRSTEIFDPLTATFSPGPTMNRGRYKMPGGAVLLDDDTVLVGGGDSLERLDVAAGTSSTVRELSSTGSFSTLNRLGAGALLLLGGYDAAIDLTGRFEVLPR